MYQEWIERLDAASSASERSGIVKELASRHGFSLDKAYRVLHEAGWSSGRKRRSDAGRTDQDEEALKILAAVMKTGLRKNDKATMLLPTARSILASNGFSYDVSDSRLRTLLRRARLDLDSQRQPSPSQRMRSLHPNQVHEVDPSLALLYYSPDRKQHLISDAEAYKNKMPLEGKEGLRLWRYVLTDHYSSSICLRYYNARGETQANLFDFLLYAWGQKKDPLYAFHGLPELLIWDPGSANMSRAISRALKSLRVDTQAHVPGNPRAKGQVECSNNLVERLFESRLRLEPVESVEEINAAAERFCAAYDSGTLEGLDTRLHRLGRVVGTRLSLWQRISAEQLRELPDAADCRLLLTLEPETRKLNGSLAFSYRHPRAGSSRWYPMHGQPGVSIGLEVEVQPILVTGEPLVIVRYATPNGELATVELLPLETDEAGFDLAGAVYGEEYKRPADTIVEQAGKELTAVVQGETGAPSGRPFAWANDGRGLAAHSNISTEGVEIKPLPKIGKQVELTEADVVSAYDIKISAAEATKRIKARSGWIPEGYLGRLKTEYPDGVPSAQIDDLAAELVSGDGARLRIAKEA